MEPIIDSSKVFSDPLDIYHSMVHDMQRAKSSVYIETFRFENDPIGEKFKNVLVKKAKEGVNIMLLLDDWGTSVGLRFFSELIEAGGKVKYFKKLRFTINFFSANHERDHRKLLIIDSKICYISSVNISNYNLNWREMSLRLEGKISESFAEVFLKNFRLKNSYRFDKRRHARSIKVGDLKILSDVPSLRITPIRKAFLKMIKSAKERIIIETPYFLPTFLLREALSKAAERGCNVSIITPMRSDVSVVNILRQRFLGKLSESGVKIWYYLPGNLHAKMMLADDKFYVGSANFDYRSFRYQFEIGLYGSEDNIVSQLLNHSQETLKNCETFYYDEWKSRGFTQKLFEWLLLPIRHFL